MKFEIRGEVDRSKEVKRIKEQISHLGQFKNLDLQLQREGREIGEKGMEYSEEETEEGTKNWSSG